MRVRFSPPVLRRIPGVGSQQGLNPWARLTWAFDSSILRLETNMYSCNNQNLVSRFYQIFLASRNMESLMQKNIEPTWENIKKEFPDKHPIFWARVRQLYINGPFV